MEENWPAYFKASLEKPRHPLWQQIDPLLQPGQLALDLGCGVGNETLHLLEMGLKVLAVDQEAEALAALRSKAPESAELQIVRSEFQSLALKEKSFDVAVAFFSLFFLREWQFKPVWARLVAALKPGGIFAGQFLGTNDEWCGRGYTCLSRLQVDHMLEPFEVLQLEEVDRDGVTILGEPKHWHIFHVLARKRQEG